MMSVVGESFTRPELVWKSQALCSGLDPELFFPELGESTNDGKAVCAACPVREACLDYAMTNNERWGIWGGTSRQERNRLRRQHAAAQFAVARGGDHHQWIAPKSRTGSD